jgi:DNA-binding transcriptional MerR regulator
MQARLSIGDFSRMTHLSVKALRHYHDLGLLEPARVDPATGYRYYDTSQVPAAQVIRWFRALEMPLDQVRAVLRAPDSATRNELIAAHLRRMEAQLEQTRETVSSLRALLEGPPAPITVEYRSVPRRQVASITETVALDHLTSWMAEGFDELSRRLRVGGMHSAGPRGGVYPTSLFTEEVGEVVLFVPVTGSVESAGRVRGSELPAAEFAVAVHEGPLGGADRTYGALGTYVTERALGVDGPIREHYLVTPDDVVDHSQLRTEICWPIVHTTG